MTFFGATNQSLFDWPWSGEHLLSGIILGAITLRYFRRRTAWTSTMGLLVLWELFEAWLRYSKSHLPGVAEWLDSWLPASWFTTESHLNSFGDLVIGAVGTGLAQLILWAGKGLKKDRS